MDIIPGERQATSRPQPQDPFANAQPPAPDPLARDPLAAPPGGDPLLNEPSDLYEPSKRSRKRGLRKLVPVIVVAVVVGGGGLAQIIREVTASPKDLAACRSTIDALETNFSTGDSMVGSLAAADNQTLRDHSDELVRAAVAEDDTRFVKSVNTVIDYCRSISSEFTDDFNAFCDRRPDACERR